MANIGFMKSIDDYYKRIDRWGFAMTVIGAAIILLAVGAATYGAVWRDVIAVLASIPLALVGAFVFDKGVFFWFFGGMQNDRPKKERRPGPWQESDGSVSMRRLSATFCFVVAATLFSAGAKTDHVYAFYGGLASLVAGVILLFFTTLTDLNTLASTVIDAARGISATPGHALDIRAVPLNATSTGTTSAPIPTTRETPPTDPSVGQG